MYLMQVEVYPVLKLQLVLGLSTLKCLRGPAPSRERRCACVGIVLGLCRQYRGTPRPWKGSVTLV